MALTARRRLFCEEYVKDRIAVRAYKRAGYSAEGHAAVACSSEIMTFPEVKAYIAQLEAAQRDKAGLKAHEILNAHARIATADPADFFDADGNPLPVHKLPKKIRMAIAGITIKPQKRKRKKGAEADSANIVAYKLCNRQESLKELAKYTSMPTTEPIRVDVTSGGEPLRSVDDRRGEFLNLLAGLEARAQELQVHELEELPEAKP